MWTHVTFKYIYLFLIKLHVFFPTLAFDATVNSIDLSANLQNPSRHTPVAFPQLFENKKLFIYIAIGSSFMKCRPHACGTSLANRNKFSKESFDSMFWNYNIFEIAPKQYNCRSALFPIISTLRVKLSDATTNSSMMLLVIVKTFDPHAQIRLNSECITLTRPRQHLCRVALPMFWAHAAAMHSKHKHCCTAKK